MTVSLIKRAYQVKHKLLEYGLEAFAADYAGIRAQIYAERELGSDEETALRDWFVLEHQLPDHRSVLSHFIDCCTDGADQVIAEQWGIVIEGVFHVRALLANNHFELMNLVNDVEYTVAGNPEELLALEKGEYIHARLLAHQDHHMFTGVIDRLPTRKKNEIYELVAEIQLHNPKMAFIDNMDRIAMAYRIQQDELQDFIAFFGDDEIVLSGRELNEKMREFYHYRFFQKKQHDSGNTIAKVFQDRYHQPPLPPHFDFLENLQSEPDIGVIYDKTEGMVFLLHYGRFREVFSQPGFRKNKQYRQILQAYLEDGNISSLPFRRMAERYPAQTAEVFKALLKRKKFDISKDLQALIRRYKPMEELTHLTPSTIPTSVRSKTFLRSLKTRSKW
ncbi:MAG: hypothetical protein ACAI44_20255 [Candidatus Sericytochromatia bacterium]